MLIQLGEMEPASSRRLRPVPAMACEKDVQRLRMGPVEDPGLRLLA